VPRSVGVASGCTVTSLVADTPIFPTVLVAEVLRASVLTPAGTVNSSANGDSASVDSLRPLTNRSTLLTGTRLVASIVIGIVAPAVSAVPAAGETIVTVGGGPGTTDTVDVHAVEFRQPSNAVAVNVI